MYANGKGVAKNEAEAVKWYRKAAEQGHASGQCKLGFMYANGKGIAKDEAEAIRWYRNMPSRATPALNSASTPCAPAAQASSKKRPKPSGYYAMPRTTATPSVNAASGSRYANGQGVKKTPKPSQWFRNAAEKGYAGAEFNLGRLTLAGNVARIEAEAVRWFRRAADQGYAARPVQRWRQLRQWQRSHARRSRSGPVVSQGRRAGPRRPTKQPQLDVRQRPRCRARRSRSGPVGPGRPTRATSTPNSA